MSPQEAACISVRTRGVPDGYVSCVSTYRRQVKLGLLTLRYKALLDLARLLQ